MNGNDEAVRLIELRVAEGSTEDLDLYLPKIRLPRENAVLENHKKARQNRNDCVIAEPVARD